jgi:hypothetical protein
MVHGRMTCRRTEPVLEYMGQVRHLVSDWDSDIRHLDLVNFPIFHSKTELSSTGIARERRRFSFILTMSTRYR